MMNGQKRKEVLTILGYNGLLSAMAVACLSVAVWLVTSGRLQQDGFDGPFLFAVGLVMTIIFSINPVLAVREGLLREVRQLLTDSLAQTGRAVKSVVPAPTPAPRKVRQHAGAPLHGTS